KTNPKITLTATDDNDPNHGFKQLEYQWNSKTGTWTTTANTTISFNPPGEGHNILYYRALDKADNYSIIGIKNIRYDSTDLEEGPQNVSVSPNPTSGSIATVSWDAASDAITIDKYEVIWQLDDTSIQYSKTVDSNTFETEIDQLTEGKWNIKVKAFDGVGNSKEGSTSLTVDRTAPDALTLVLESTGVGTANLSWNTVDDAEEYLIFYGTTSGDYIYGANVGNVTNYTVQELGAGNYYFIVRAKDASDNQSSNSNEVNTGTIAGVPGATPGGPGADFVPAGEVQGATNDSESESKTDDVVGKVMGVNETSSWVKSNLPWMLLILQAGLIILADHLNRRKRGFGKYLMTLLITILSIAIFNWSNSSLNSIMNWFMLVSVSLAILLKVFNYAFIEDQTN
ncbi:fibronectin type III domain-containing protein, partial [Patescibacteria group bacterium]|nr:fibronectin type III domain-containing protein [Patescibacteria group bacterium]